MATLSTAGRNAAATAIAALIDAGTAGDIRFLDGSTLLVTMTMSNPSFTGPSTGVLTMDTSPAVSGVAVAAGTADRYTITDGTTAVITGAEDSVAEGAGAGVEIVIDDTSIGVGDTVTMTALTITVVAS